MKNYLNVPFADKDKAKAKGARWDAVARKWYCEANYLTACMEWVPAHLRVPSGLTNTQKLKHVRSLSVTIRSGRTGSAGQKMPSR